jgi:nucleotide-binding universal stress UspA family protein
MPESTNVRTILAPTDFSPAGRRALGYAAALARAFGAKLIVVHAVEVTPETWDELPGEMFLPKPASWHELAQRVLAHQEAEAQRDAAALRAEVPHVETIVRRGVARQVILDAAREVEAGLIVMGTHGRSGFNRLVLGSVAEYVVRHSPVPVMVVRQTDIGTG